MGALATAAGGAAQRRAAAAAAGQALVRRYLVEERMFERVTWGSTDKIGLVNVSIFID